jgi:hypothetical protein
MFIEKISKKNKPINFQHKRLISNINNKDLKLYKFIDTYFKAYCKFNKISIDQIINSSGFYKYYDRIPGSLKPDFDLRLNTNSTNNQELIKITPVDDIMKKLTLILERLSSPDKLPIFRWAENQGFRVECRNDITPDTDLKFTGFVEKGARTGLQFEIASNSNNT